MSLYSLVYASTATRPFSPEELERLMANCRPGNGVRGITGMLVYRDGEFMQVLEGEKDAVQATYERISRDPRHHSLVVVLEEFISERAFPDWRMGFCDLGNVNSSSHPGYSDFLKTPLTGREFAESPRLAQQMLLSFKEKGWLATAA